MPISQTLHKGLVPVHIFTDDIEHSALQQLLFIEICLDEEQRVWVMLHFGSRGIGNVIGRYFIAAAQKDMQRHKMNLPDRDLAYFSEGSALFDDYVDALEWAQDYALINRSEMMRRVKRTATSACSSPARERSRRAKANSASFPAAWAPRATSCAARAIRHRSAPARTGPDAG
jgi:hypothetical protein